MCANLSNDRCAVRGPGLFFVLAVLFAGVALARAPDVQVESASARIALQREVGSWLEATLREFAQPYRLLATVEFSVRDDTREVVQRESQSDTVMKVGSNRAVKLPGLPPVDRPLNGYAAPDISVTVPGKQRVEVRQELRLWIERIRVHLFVERGMPPALLEQIKTTAAGLVGLDPTRGDSLDVSELSSTPRPSLLELNAQTILVCSTVLLSALLLALGLALGRRRAEGGVSQLTADLGLRAPAAEPEAEVGSKPDEAEGEPVVGEGEPAGVFASLTAVPPVQLAEALASLDVATMAAVVERAGQNGELSRRLLEALPAEKQVQLLRAAGYPRVVSAEEVVAMETAVLGAVAVVRSRVKFGGDGPAAGLLEAAPAEMQGRLFGELSRVDPRLSQTLRQRVVFFEDLGHLPESVVREVVATVGPATTAAALVGADVALRAKVMKSVSARLQGILEAEGGAHKTSEEVYAARKAIEVAMRTRPSAGVSSAGGA